MSLLDVVLLVLVPLVFVLAIVPTVIKIAYKIKAVDEPNHRKVHQKEMPRIGGLSIFLGLIIGFVFFSNKFLNSGVSVNNLDSNFYFVALNYKKMVAIFLASFVMILIGIIDDIGEMKARDKLVGQIAAACIIVFYGNIEFSGFTLLGFNVNFAMLSAIVSVFWIISIVNAINLIDGLDGLAGGISSIYFLTIAIVALFAKYYDPVAGEMIPINDTFTASLSLIMLGSTIGFLFYNFYPAKVFMGDTGSLFLGLIISVLPLLGFKNVTVLALFVPLLILAVPTLDIIFAILRRLIRRKGIGEADKDHIHHQLFNMNFGHRNTVLLIYAISGMFSFVAIIFSLYSAKAGMIMFGVSSVLVLIFIEKTSILTEEFKPLSHLLRLIKRLLFIDKLK